MTVLTTTAAARTRLLPPDDCRDSACGFRDNGDGAGPPPYLTNTLPARAATS